QPVGPSSVGTQAEGAEVGPGGAGGHAPWLGSALEKSTGPDLQPELATLPGRLLVVIAATDGKLEDAGLDGSAADGAAEGVQLQAGRQGAGRNLPVVEGNAACGPELRRVLFAHGRAGQRLGV